MPKEMNTNRKRAERAKQGLVAYLQARDGKKCEAVEDVKGGDFSLMREHVIDLLCDLMHLSVLASMESGRQRQGSQPVIEAQTLADEMYESAHASWLAEAICSECDEVLISSDDPVDYMELTCPACTKKIEQEGEGESE